MQPILIVLLISAWAAAATVVRPIFPLRNVTFQQADGKVSFAGSMIQVSPTVTVYVPPQVCKPENCPPPLGTCTSPKECTYKNGFNGLKTHPFGYVTHYCKLSTGGCSGVTQINLAHVTAERISKSVGIKLCENAGSQEKCMGIVALSPILMGNSQLATDPVTGLMIRNWGMGLTEASGNCYELDGPGGVVLVAITDRCAGYCTCSAMTQKGECAPCLNELAEGGKRGLTPGCPCVGPAPSLWPKCCGLSNYDCPTLDNQCDWCASANHPNFDVDDDAFNHVCGTAGAIGSCRLKSVKVVKCAEPLKWPPGGAGGGCGANAFTCEAAPSPDMPQIPDCGCCCNWGFKPLKDGSCSCSKGEPGPGPTPTPGPTPGPTPDPTPTPGPTPDKTCGANTYWCDAGTPDMPKVDGCPCCCNWGHTPSAGCSCTMSKKMRRAILLSELMN